MNIMSIASNILGKKCIFEPYQIHLWRRKWQPTPVFLPRGSCGQRSLVGCCPWGHTESDMTEATQHACMHWRRQWQPTPVFLPGESQGQRSLVGCCPWGHTESDMTEATYMHALEKEMATHSSILAWRIPGMGEPGGLPPMGLHRVGHN